MKATVALCVALLALALATAAAAGGRNDLYTGPIEQAPIKGLPHETKIEIFVWTQHHRDGRITRFISYINIYDVHALCENGEYLGAGDPTGNTDTIQVDSHTKMEIKGGSFSEPRGYGGYGGERVMINGSVSKRSASGTLTVSFDGGTAPAEIEGEPPRHFGTCTTGTLRWTATRNG